MRISILTAFSNFLSNFTSISKNIKRIIEDKVIDMQIVDIRDFGRVDDSNCGGTGMVYTYFTLKNALRSIAESEEQNYVINFSPRGLMLNQNIIQELCLKKHLTLVCGRYEGVDERFIAQHVDLEISIGSYIVSNGEISAVVLLDAICRLLGTVKASSLKNESFNENKIDASCFALPREVDNMKIPDVLLQGNHKEIDKWRNTYSLINTLLFYPEMLKKHLLSMQDHTLLKQIRKLIDKILL